MRIIGLLSVCLLTSFQITTAQNSVLVLKGNVLTPVPASKATSQTPVKKNPHADSIAAAKKAASKQAPVVKAPAPKPAPVVKAPAPKPAPVVVKAPAPKPAPVVKAPAPKPAPDVVKAPAPKPAPVVKAPAPKPAPVVVKTPTKVVPVKTPVLAQVDYIKRVQFVHNLVSRKIPQTVIDSIGEINHDLLDSIRREITKHKDKDSINFLKAALANGVNDSITLFNIDNLVNSTAVNTPADGTGSLNTSCIDISTQAPIDSVKVEIFSHDSLILTTFTDNQGSSKIPNMKPGEYNLNFSKNNYTPFSERWIKVTAGNPTYVQMPLTEIPRFYLPKFSAQIWAMIAVGLISVFVLIYSIIRRLGRVA